MDAKKVKTIFRAYDVRGVYPEEINEEVCYKTGMAVANFLNAKKMTVGYDYRLSSESLAKALIDGICDAGCDAIDIGHVPTPVLYFSICRLNVDGGIMITASHNPPEYNGMKIQKENAMPIFSENGLFEIRDMVLSGDLKKSGEKGNVEKVNVMDDYINEVVSRVKIERPLKILIDTGNGACFDIPERIFKALGCEAKTIFKEPDGHFPNHIADPLKTETLETLKNKVVDEGFDIGLAFDGDGDRLGIVDSRGKILTQDEMLMMFTKQALETKKGYVIYEVRVSNAVIEYAKKLGGKVKISKVGHTYIVEEIKKLNAVFGGELSGHTYFPYCYYPFDDGIFAAAKAVEFASKNDLSKFVDSLPKTYATPEIHIKVNDNVKFALIEKVKEMLINDGFNVNDIDGVRVDFEDGWFLIRASNTEPMIKCRVEGKSQEDLENIKSLLMEYLGKAGILKDEEE